MELNRIQYSIDFLHIITFSQEYKYAIAPFFMFDGLEYAIEDQFSVNENIRLILRNEKIAFFVRKEGLTFIHEGDGSALRDNNGIIKIFWDLFAKITQIKGFTRPFRHSIVVNAIDYIEEGKSPELLDPSRFISFNPFGKLTEFATAYEFMESNATFKINIGNFSNRDIKSHDLFPFTSKNSSISTKTNGIHSRIELIAAERDPSFHKFSALFSKVERKLSLISKNNINE